MNHIKWMATVFLVFASAVLDFLGLWTFVLFHSHTNNVCFLFCKIEERSRRIESGNLLNCYSVIFLLAVSILLKCIFLHRIYTKKVLSLKIIRYIPVLSFLHILLNAWGLYSTCSYALVHTGIGRCVDVSFQRIDFFAFTPKYVRGFSFPSTMMYILIYTCISISMWFLVVVVHTRNVIIR